MAFSYNADLTDPLDYIRFRLDDKVEEYREYEDEELLYFIDKISGTPTETDLDKIALKLLKQQLQELLRAPSRERAGQIEVYKSSAQSLKAAIQELEDEIESTLHVPSMYTGGLYKDDVCDNRNNDNITDSKFDRDQFFYEECVPDRSDRIGY